MATAEGCKLARSCWQPSPVFDCKSASLKTSAAAQHPRRPRQKCVLASYCCARLACSPKAASCCCCRRCCSTLRAFSSTQRCIRVRSVSLATFTDSGSLGLENISCKHQLSVRTDWGLALAARRDEALQMRQHLQAHWAGKSRAADGSAAGSCASCTRHTHAMCDGQQGGLTSRWCAPSGMTTATTELVRLCSTPPPLHGSYLHTQLASASHTEQVLAQHTGCTAAACCPAGCAAAALATCESWQVVGKQGPHPPLLKTMLLNEGRLWPPYLRHSSESLTPALQACACRRQGRCRLASRVPRW